MVLEFDQIITAPRGSAIQERKIRNRASPGLHVHVSAAEWSGLTTRESELCKEPSGSVIAGGRFAISEAEKFVFVQIKQPNKTLL